MPGYERDMFSSVLKTRYQVPVKNNEFGDLLKQLDKVPSRKDGK